MSEPAAAVVDLLGMLAYGELLAFDRMAADARLAPDLQRRAVLSEMAAVEIANYRRLAGRLSELGADPQDAMAPYVQALQEYHDSTEPKDWLEALTKAYVGDSIADDFFREMAAYWPTPDRDLVLRCCTIRGTTSSPATRSARRSRPTRRSPTGCRCGPGAWSARGSRRPTGGRRAGGADRPASLAGRATKAAYRPCSAA